MVFARSHQRQPDGALVARVTHTVPRDHETAGATRARTDLPPSGIPTRTLESVIEALKSAPFSGFIRYIEA